MSTREIERYVDARELAEPSAPARLLTAEQAGALLNVPPSWLLAQARRDCVPHVRLGRYVRFDPAALEAWWKSRMRGPVDA